MTGRNISMIGAMSTVCASTLGVGVLAFPRLVVETSNTAALLVVTGGIVVALVGPLLLVLLGRRFPGQTIVEYGEVLFGKWLGRFATVCIIVFFGILTALTAREFGEIVVTSVLLRTPIEITVVAMVLLAVIGSRNEIRTVTYVCTLYLPLIVAPALVIVLLSFKAFNPLYLQPFLGEIPRLMNHYISGVIIVAALFQPSFIISMIMPYMENPAQALRSVVFSWLISALVYILTMAATLGVFGPEETKSLMWSTLELAKYTSIPGGVLERLDAAFIALWVAAVFTTLLSSYFVTVGTLSSVLRLGEHKLFSVILFPFICLFAMTPPNVLSVYHVVRITGSLGLILTIGYPLLLYCTAILRGKRGLKA